MKLRVEITPNGVINKCDTLRCYRVGQQRTQKPKDREPSAFAFMKVEVELAVRHASPSHISNLSVSYLDEQPVGCI